MIMVAFYTVNTPYEEEVKGLIESCKKFNIRFDVRGFKSRGSWRLNSNIKTEFIRDMLDEHKEDVLHLDADARFRKSPVLFINEFPHDIGVYFRNDTKPLCGTIYFKNNDRVKEMVQRWIKEQSKYPGTSNQKIFKRVLKYQCDDLKLDICNIPPSYTQIYDTMKHFGEPVIEHMQASRRFKFCSMPAQ